MIGVSTSSFNLSMLRTANVWYSICDGNWSNPNTWLSNGRKKHSSPQVGDTVYVDHVVTVDVATIRVKNIYISGTLLATASPAVSITVDGDCQVSGSGLISLPSQFHNLTLNGYTNMIPYSGFNAGSFSTVTYNGLFDQAILNIPYNNLATQNTGRKYQISDITIGGAFTPQSNYECGVYNLTVNGSSTIGVVGGAYSFSKNSSTGSILFVGSVDVEGTVDLSTGNPNVEFRGGLSIHTLNLTSGSGTFTFSTNNQNITCSAYLGGIWNASIIVQGTITLTLTGGSAFETNSTINGTVSGSTFNNNGVLYLGYNSTPMSTGVFNYENTTSSTLGYTFNGAFTLPYSNYANLYIAGTGVKTSGTNTTVNQTFVNDGWFDFGGYDFNCTGAFSHNSVGDLTASAFSSITIGGIAKFNNPSGGIKGADLRTGNPNIEFKGGISIHNQYVWSGTGVFKFSTNNQNIDFPAYNGGAFNCSVLISGTITVTFITASPVSIQPLTGTLNGDNASSTFINNGTWQYNNAQQPMQTGLLLCNQAANTFIYGLLGGQDITTPSDSTPGYKNLTLNGSGAKRLLGNVSVKGTYILTSPTTLNSNGFALTNP